MTVNVDDVQVGPIVPANGVSLISLDFDPTGWSAEWIEVYRNEVLLSLGNDYSVSNAGTVSASLTLVTPGNGVDSYVIRLATPAQRTSDLQLRGEFRSEVFNREIDRIWQRLQFQSTETSRAIQAPVGQVGLRLGAVTPDRVLRVSDDGQSVVDGPTTGDIEGAAAAAQTATDAATTATGAATTATDQAGIATTRATEATTAATSASADAAQAASDRATAEAALNNADATRFGTDIIRNTGAGTPYSGERRALVDTQRALAGQRIRPNGVTIYCDPNATGAGDGSSWADAFTDMNAAFTAATPGSLVLTNAPQSAPFPMQRITVSVEGVEWITNRGPDGVTWVDGRKFGAWAQSGEVFSTAVASEPEYVVYNLRQDDETGTVTGVDLTRQDIRDAILHHGRTPANLVAWYGFLEKEASATSAPTQGKWSWVSGTLYINPTGTPTLTEVNDNAAWSDLTGATTGNGVLFSGATTDVYIHGDLRTFFTPAFNGGQGYGVRFVAATRTTLADHTAYLCGYHAAGMVASSSDENTILRSVTVGEIATSSGSGGANPYVFYTANRDYEDANHHGLDLLFIAFPELNELGAPIPTIYSPKLGFSHTSETTFMKGVRWSHCSQIDFIEEMNVKHGTTLGYAVGFISANDIGGPQDIDQSAPWPVVAADCVAIGIAASPVHNIEYRNCKFDRKDYGNVSDILINYNVPGTGRLKMVGGYWGCGKMQRAISAHGADDATLLQNVHIVMSPIGAELNVFVQVSGTPSDFRMGGCYFEVGDEFSSFIMLDPIPWGSGGNGLPNVYTSLGGNIFGAELVIGYRHSNPAVTRKTVAELIAISDPDNRDLTGY